MRSTRMESMALARQHYSNPVDHDRTPIHVPSRDMWSIFMPSLERSTARSSLLTTTALLVFAVAAAAVPGMARAEAPSADGVAMPSAEGTSGDAITVTGQRQSTDTAIA